MHLEGPGPIPVDDPEAAECHLEFDRWCRWSLVSSDGGTIVVLLMEDIRLTTWDV